LVKENVRLSVEIPDETYWKHLINCQDTCPVQTDVRGYVCAIADGKYEQAYRIARGPNPLASICGRVCGASCEEACRRASLDAPVAIRALKRFVTERYGPESLPGNPLAAVESVREITSQNAALDELCHLIRAKAKGKAPATADQKVAIIGAGPAGLACAHDLALLGFDPVIFEMEQKPAGMLYTGIPEFRLPRKVIDAEVEVILNLGVEIRCNTTVGQDISFDQIRREFSATVIAVGAKHSRKIQIAGEDAQGVLGGVEFLRQLSLGKEVQLGKQVVVVGGGFTAMDCSRSSLRVGVSDVVMVLYRRTRDEMPVSNAELEETGSEGIHFQFLVTPLAIEKDTIGKVTGVRLQKNRLGPPDADGRRRPVPIPGSEFVQPCDTVITAIGQQTDLNFIDEKRDGLTFNKWGLIDCDEDTLVTKAQDVFLAGDAAYGTQLIIDAVASGKKAARSIYRLLTGRTISIERVQKHKDLGMYECEIGFERVPRMVMPLAEKEKRIVNQKICVEQGFDETLACLEAKRCLDCSINTIFDGQKCILCGGCVDLCPSLCLKLLQIKELKLTEAQQATARECLGEGWEQGTAIIKDEEACIRCGLCARRCPTDAITMERMEFSEAWL